MTTTFTRYTDELSKTFSLAWPLIVAQLAVISINTTDVIMMGWLGPEYLAAGTMATAIIHPLFLAFIAFLSVLTPLIAQNLVSRKYKEIRRTTRQGLWFAIVMSAISIPLMLQINEIILFLQLDPKVGLLAQQYMDAAVWYLIPVYMFFVLRNFVTAHGDSKIVLKITLAAIVLNALGNYTLMFGKLGFPPLGLTGAGISTTIVNSFMFLALLYYVLRHRRYKRYYILVRIYKADWSIFRKILKMGFPVALMVAAESSLFSVASIFMGWLGTEELAGHAVALQLTAIAFMIPLGLSNATSVRVGYGYGAKNLQMLTTSGWVSIAMGIGFMVLTLSTFLIIPEYLVHLFLDPNVAGNQTAIGFAVSYVLVVTIFQIADGGQVVAAAALRGINDTTVPMFIAIIGYWLVGIPIAYVLAFVFDMRGVGVWLGLAIGLIFAAIALIHRFWALTKKVKFE
ncbi:MATE family efflux transporter [Gammaproteobacteria bacterium AS21]